jgi:hypothetical protein
MADLLDLTATQVRYRNEPIHDLETIETKPMGRVYVTVCGAQIRARAGGVLTTTPARCTDCAAEVVARLLTQ